MQIRESYDDLKFKNICGMGPGADLIKYTKINLILTFS